MSKIGAIIYGVLGLVAFLFVLVGTPIDQFRGKNQSLTEDTPCLTLWGKKDNCYSTRYDHRPAEIFAGCDTLVKMFKAAEGLALISIILLLVAALLGLLTCCCCGCLRCFASVLTVLGMLTLVVVWAAMAYSYNNRVDGCLFTPFKRTYKYGVGFALILTGWCILFVAIVVLNLL